MRVRTWNLQGRWSEEHRDLLRDVECDVWLLTEVNDRVEIDGYEDHRTKAAMVARRRRAAVYSRNCLTPLPDPHPASAAAVVDGVTYCSSILPWRGCGSVFPWVGTRHVEWTAAAVEDLAAALPSSGLVWGGDWNHALSGREEAGSKGGRKHVLTAIEHFDLQVPTAKLPHRIDGLLSIDHVAVGRDQAVSGAMRIPAPSLSDHDAYVIEFELANPGRS
jgi:endonuclease/exonuclease/phosphatase family metal-dependent hydrolase